MRINNTLFYHHDVGMRSFSKITVPDKETFTGPMFYCLLVKHRVRQQGNRFDVATVPAYIIPGDHTDAMDNFLQKRRHQECPEVHCGLNIIFRKAVHPGSNTTGYLNIYSSI